MTWLSWLGLSRRFDPDPPQPSQYALNVARIAQWEIGHGEEVGNNLGPHLDLYRKGGPAGPWCAAFVSWCLEEGAKLGSVPESWIINPQRGGDGRPLAWDPSPLRGVPRRSHSAKRLFGNCLRVGMRVDRPLRGDLVLWHRGAKGARTGHIGIVSLYRDNVFWSVEGNRGGYPSKVREYMHELGEALLLGFCRLP